MAGGASQDNDEGMITGINVTPFVDVALVLLIIFIVTAKIIVAQPSIPIDLPRAASSQQQVINNTVQITVDRAGTIFVDAHPTDEAQLRSVIAQRHAANADVRAGTIFVDAHPTDENQLRAVMVQRHAANADVRAVIAADRAAPYGSFAHVVDVVRLAGVSHFAIQTELPTNLQQ